MSPVEQALLAEKCTPQNRNAVFAANAFVGSMMGALGALLSGLPQHLQENWAWQPIASYKPLFALTIVFSAVLIFAYSRIDEHHVAKKRAKKPMVTKANAFVLKMSLLGMIDNLGGGLVSPLISYWFFLRYGVELKSLGFMFFLSYFLAAMSFLTAPIIARKIGVVRTMASPRFGIGDLALPAAGADVCDRRRPDHRSVLSGLYGQSTQEFLHHGRRSARRSRLRRRLHHSFTPCSGGDQSDDLGVLNASVHVERADIYRRLPAVLSRLRLLFHVPRRETARRRRGYVANGDGLIMGLLRNLHRDAKLLMASRGIRAFAFSI